MRIALADGATLRVRWLKGHAYAYRRVYVGSAMHARPIYRDEYLGRVDDALVLAGDVKRVLAAAKRRGWG